MGGLHKTAFVEVGVFKRLLVRAIRHHSARVFQLIDALPAGICRQSLDGSSDGGIAIEHKRIFHP